MTIPIHFLTLELDKGIENLKTVINITCPNCKKTNEVNVILADKLTPTCGNCGEDLSQVELTMEDVRK